MADLLFSQDVIKLTSLLGNLYSSYDVPFAKWNHLDYLWGIDADTLVYNELIKKNEHFISSKLQQHNTNI